MKPLSLPALETIARFGQIKAEPRNDAEVKCMLENGSWSHSVAVSACKC